MNWRSISLLEKNQPPPDSEYFQAATISHGYLRVMEAVKKAEGNDAVSALYTQFGARIHHDGELDFDLAEVLQQVDLDPGHSAAADDASWDEVIRAEMDEGLALTGADVGTPILAIPDAEGNKVGLFGPVISRIPPTEQALQLWDGFLAVASAPGFWELKRTRTEGPVFGPRPKLAG